MDNKTRRPFLRGRASACGFCISGLALALAAANAPAAVLFEENFTSGLGAFDSRGRVYSGSGSISMRGGGSTATGVRTGPIAIDGARDLTLSFYRDISRFDNGEALTASVSTNGSTFQAVQTVNSGSGTVTVDLGNVVSGEGQIYLQFAINASSFFESAELGSILLEGSGANPDNPENPDNPDDPDTPDHPGGDDEPMPEAGDFVTFESGHVRPMALSSDGNRLYVVNTPDNTVQVFDVSGNTPTAVETIPVGMEPVSVALRDDGELWVVNHLSDSVSIVDVSGSPARVSNTLLVGDEPRDIVFAGAGDKWAFITAAHRGQNVPFDPRLTTPGIGRADVWVFDTNNPGFQLGGEPVTILNMFGDTLRGLARSPDGSKVYTAVFNSGNRTTVLDEEIPDGGLDKPGPQRAADGTDQPRTGLIVKFDGRNWVDNGDPVRGESARTWNDLVKLELPDNDVFEIDASGSVPRVTSRTTGVGTTLFNLAVNPRSGKVYVSNQEANNLTRFEGPGLNSTTVNGNFVQSRITVVDGTSAQPRHLNKHIDYSTRLGTASERQRAVAIPLQMAVSSDGEKLFMASMGANKLVRYDTGALESDSFQPDTNDQLVVGGGGATGVVLDEARGRAFVTTRFDNGVSVVDVDGTMNELAHVTMHNPEPQKVVEGRRFLYDATYTSSRGDSSCAGCHTFGDMDHLSWDLGNPDIASEDNPNQYNENVPAFGRNLTFHAMKGPMATQSLRGLKGNGPMHWRGDRTGENRARGETLEMAAFKEFNEAFRGLLRRDSELTEAEMTSFAEFALELTYPPNPIAALDNSLSPQLQEAMEIYNTVNSDFVTNCNGCHVLDPDRGMFGTDGTMSAEGGDVDEDMKIPHLRNMYQKVGMFTKNGAGRPEMGPQIRGFGFDNQGASGSVDNFLSAPVFLLLGERRRLLVEQLSLAFPSEMNPIVGQQVTINPDNRSRTDVQARLELLVERALVTNPRPECDLVATAVLGGQSKRWVFNANEKFVPGDRATPSLTRSQLLDQVTGEDSTVTFTCTPPGSGVRMAAGN
ncbi:40-residue YVTN family beta-propeller repeat-containing protein [Marinobacter daqiaonensis]|uniref:40-residue YVTN family beta-propeller repeat-containing protein n=1 Tax=Marinobacter daqiaonensis TaxID=650891 RepID=A0A1I6GGZ3_9GAMM|nr:YncE family protein [Marinobacter daqiaonensis]SFR41465.1 40-residue YVTN family beta-propeller repeat-containing protein [Marinobacter daqiaonensis]